MDRKVPGLSRRAIAADITPPPITAALLRIAGLMRVLIQRRKLKVIAARTTQRPTTAVRLRIAGPMRALIQRRKLKAIAALITPHPTTAVRLLITGRMAAVTQRRALRAFPLRARPAADTRGFQEDTRAAGTRVEAATPAAAVTTAKLLLSG